MDDFDKKTKRQKKTKNTKKDSSDGNRKADYHGGELILRSAWMILVKRDEVNNFEDL